jgi:hypothetical protein
MSDKPIAYLAGNQWGRMSWSSRIGALAAGMLLLAFVIAIARYIADADADADAAPPAVAAKAAGPTPSERQAQAQETQARILREKCTTGLPALMQEAQAKAKDGDEHMAAAILNPCNSIANDPALVALVKKIEAARMIKVAKAAKEEVARKKKEGVRVGMSKEDVVASMWGKPRKINRTTTAHGTREQWVYDGGYLYFDEDTLTTIQN